MLKPCICSFETLPWLSQGSSGFHRRLLTISGTHELAGHSNTAAVMTAGTCFATDFCHFPPLSAVAYNHPVLSLAHISHNEKVCFLFLADKAVRPSVEKRVCLETREEKACERGPHG